MSTRNTVLALAIALTGSICMLNYATGPSAEIWWLYLAPIGVASFFLGPRYGYALILFTGVLQFMTGGLAGKAYPAIAAFLSENGAAASVYVVCAYVIGLMRVLGHHTEGGGPIDALTRPE